MKIKFVTTYSSTLFFVDSSLGRQLKSNKQLDTAYSSIVSLLLSIHWMCANILWKSLGNKLSCAVALYWDYLEST